MVQKREASIGVRAAVEQMDAQPREAEGTAFGQSGGDAEATAGRGRWRFTSACSGELGVTGAETRFCT